MSEKKRKMVGIVLIAIIAICVIGIVATPSKKEDEETTNAEVATTTEPVEQDSELESESEQSEAEEPQAESTLDEMSIIFSDSVRNDVTGKWRLAKVTGNKSAEEYAADYYREYFKEDNEVHAVVNFTLNTTACITYVGGEINVRIYEYEDGEEHDAKALFGGEKLEEYNVDPDTGAAEKVE